MSNRVDIMENQAQNRKDLVDLVDIFASFFKMLMHNILLVIILAALCAGLMVGYTKYKYVPVYTASATYTVNIQSSSVGSTSSYYDRTTATGMATSFRYLLPSSIMQRRIKAAMGDRGTAAKISASVVEGTNLLTISASSSDPQLSYDTLITVMDVYPELSESIVGKTYMVIVDEAVVPSAPDNPYSYTEKAVEGCIIGLVIAVLIVIVKSLTQKTISKEEDFRRYLHIRCLGSFPYVVHSTRKQRAADNLLLTNPKYEGVLDEPLRLLRNRLESRAKEGDFKTILVTSSVAGEGKSTISVNLALSLIQNGKRVVLIDCDMRKPSDHEVFGMEQTKGLKEVLEKEISLSEAMISGVNLDIPNGKNLIFVPGGAPVGDSARYFNSPELEALIKSSKKVADYVILDGAPIGIMTDSALLANHADATVFIVSKDRVRVDFIIDSLEALAQIHTPIIGGILNGV
ncbi:MAG: polysaccharide biosynthesis tyrosine autokinase [Erysipelotrichaceae bacterium]|nr:polysaccharide biosynthesis tyrosine autokinase [Erysipelotrichaceae bacterium]